MPVDIRLISLVGCFGESLPVNYEDRHVSMIAGSECHIYGDKLYCFCNEKVTSTRYFEDYFRRASKAIFKLEKKMEAETKKEDSSLTKLEKRMDDVISRSRDVEDRVINLRDKLTGTSEATEEADDRPEPVGRIERLEYVADLIIKNINSIDCKIESIRNEVG